MQSKLIRSGVLGAMTALIVGLLPAMPAFAANLNGSASITSSRDLLAGRLHDMTFSVANPSTATGGIIGETQERMNYIQIVPASGFTLGCPAATQGIWSCNVTAKGFLEFETSGTNGLNPGTNQSFNILASAPRPANDSTRTWQVQMSPDNGETGVNNDPTTPGALDTVTRVLQVVSVLIAGPAGAMDNTVTSGQNNTLVDVTVINAGSADKETTATLTSPGNDSVRGTPPGPQNISAYSTATGEDSATFRFGYNFGSTGSRRLTGDATALGANAFEALSAPITIQTPANLTYVVGTLQPVASRSGVPQTFGLSFTKTGDPSVRDLDGTLTFTRNDQLRTFTADLTAPPSYPEGNSAQAHSFVGTVPGDANQAGTGGPLDFDGDYSLSTKITGTDGNDAVVDLTKSVSDIFTIDNLVPGVLPTITTPNKVGQAGEQRSVANNTPGRDYVVKNGQTFTVGGTVTKAATSSTPDTTAQVVNCELRVYDLSGTQVGNFPQPRTACRENGAGGLTGSFAVANLGVDLGTARLYVEVADRVPGNVGFGLSTPVIVDNVRPTFASGATGCRGLTAAECAGGETRTIQVPTTEVVTGTFLAAEFTCTDEQGGNVVTNATFNGNATTYGNRVVLTLAREMDTDSQPSCNYVLAPLQAAALDSPTNAFQTPVGIPVIDDIAPDLPSIDQVSGRSAYPDDNKFYTNDSTADVSLGGLRPGYTGIVARETNGQDGYQFGFDDELCRFASGDDQGSCSTEDLGGDSPRNAVTGEPEGYKLYGASLDARGNVSFDKDGLQVGNGTPFELVLDRVSPLTTTALVNSAGRTITVDFDEKLDRGTNAFRDWVIHVTTADGESQLLTPATITNDGFDKKVLNINSTAPNWNGSTVTSIVYMVEDNQARRFEDRAGNLLLDFPPARQPTIT